LSVKTSSADPLSALLAARFSVARVLAASRAALGLLAVLLCWRRRRGAARVALPGAVCQEVVLAVLAAGCEPLFCDVDIADGLVKESEWVRARSLGADVAIVVHLYGNPAPMARVRSIFPAPDCLIVDDAAQALGSMSPDGPAGALGDVGLLSFGPTKHITLGNAALLFRNGEFSEEVTSLLQSYVSQSEAVRSALTANFRAHLDVARARLRSEGDSAACMFAGLLNGMEGVLHVPVTAGVEEQLLAALEDYPNAMAARQAKARLWSHYLAGSGFEAVGMGAGCVPWRYVCRLPGIQWQQQHHFAEAMRAGGMHVSSWYLPAHWFTGMGPGTLPGVERLSREVFQFWLDPATSLASITAQAQVVRRTTSMACASTAQGSKCDR
jgi:hypothetical protein